MVSIELNHDPKILLACSDSLTCVKCGKCTAVVIGDQITCVTCMIQQSGKSFVIVSGWQLTLSALTQINASRIPT